MDARSCSGSARWPAIESFAHSRAGAIYAGAARQGFLDVIERSNLRELRRTMLVNRTRRVRFVRRFGAPLAAAAHDLRVQAINIGIVYMIDPFVVKNTVGPQRCRRVFHWSCRHYKRSRSSLRRSSTCSVSMHVVYRSRFFCRASYQSYALAGIYCLTYLFTDIAIAPTTLELYGANESESFAAHCSFTQEETWQKEGYSAVLYVNDAPFNLATLTDTANVVALEHRDNTTLGTAYVRMLYFSSPS